MLPSRTHTRLDDATTLWAVLEQLVSKFAKPANKEELMRILAKRQVHAYNEADVQIDPASLEEVIESPDLRTFDELEDDSFKKKAGRKSYKKSFKTLYKEVRGLDGPPPKKNKKLPAEVVAASKKKYAATDRINVEYA
eukprot:627760-Pyramimonas_sp.AAC.1